MCRKEWYFDIDMLQMLSLEYTSFLICRYFRFFVNNMEQTKKPGYEEIYAFALEIICIEMIYRHSKYNFFCIPV